MALRHILVAEQLQEVSRSNLSIRNRSRKRKERALAMLGPWDVCHAGGVGRRTLSLTDASHSPSSPSPLRVGMAGVGHDRPQDWIVGVALLRAAIERLAIEGAKRHIEIKPGHKVRVADEGLAKRDEIGAPLRDCLVGAHFVEAVIGHQEPAEEPLDRQIVKGRNRGPARVAVDHMKISETSTRECRGAGYVQSLARPGGNATGFIPFEFGTSGKWLELLKEI